MIDKNILITIFLYLYLTITTVFFNDIFIIRTNTFSIIFLLLKWVLNYRRCTISYIECKLRNVKKEKSYMYNYCEFFGDLIYSEYNDILFIILVIILLINLFKVLKYIKNLIK